MSSFTLTETARHYRGPGDVWVDLDVTGPDSYETDGSLADIEAATDPAVATASDAVFTTQSEAYDFIFIPDKDAVASAAKIIVIDRTTGLQEVATTNLETTTFKMSAKVG